MEYSCDPAGAKEVPGYPLGGCGVYTDGQWSVCVCVCVQSVVVTQLVPRRCQATHWAAVVRTLMVSCVSVRTVWLDASVTLVNLATGTCVSTILTAVKVRRDVHC